jgi:hypothetical protein
MNNRERTGKVFIALAMTLAVGDHVSRGANPGSGAYRCHPAGRDAHGGWRNGYAVCPTTPG